VTTQQKHQWLPKLYVLHQLVHVDRHRMISIAAFVPAMFRIIAASRPGAPD
jgi:hypothetical protein